jgi:hypothetical protein
MTETTVINKEILDKLRVERFSDLPIVFSRALGDKRVVTVVLVSDKTDRFNTIINPGGCITDYRNVTVDFNHQGIESGAELKNKRIEAVTLDDGSKVRALVGDIYIYPTTRLAARDKNGREYEVMNAIEAIDNKWIKSVSVDFLPYKQSTNTRTGVTTFTEWGLTCLSLLNIVPGQEDSFIINITRKLSMQYNEGDQIRITMPGKIKEVTEQQGKRMFSIELEMGNEIEMDEESMTLYCSPIEPKKREDEEPIKPEAKTKDEVKTDLDEVRVLNAELEKTLELKRLLAETQIEKPTKPEAKTKEEVKTDSEDEAQAEAYARAHQRIQAAPEVTEGLPSTQLEETQDNNVEVKPTATLAAEYARQLYLAKLKK